MPLEKFDDITAQFSNLTKLRQSLELDDRHHGDSSRSSIAVRLICTATNLRCLCLDGYDSEAEKREMSTFMTVLGDATLPKLKSLILANFSSTEAQLVTFLKRSKGLDQLSFLAHTLTEGSWERFAARTKNILALKSV